MTRQASYEEQVGLMSEMGELDACEAFQLFDEETDPEQACPLVGWIWRGVAAVFPEQVKEGSDAEI